jgi:hypothetical protein
MARHLIFGGVPPDGLLIFRRITPCNHSHITYINQSDAFDHWPINAE